MVRSRRRALGVHRALACATVVWHPVHLKSLTLKGFKSFASPTTLRFETGITCVVGPNGSGKSNVVDALDLGDGRAGRQEPARRQDGGRHLRGHVVARPAGPRRGDRHDRQLRQRAANRVLRGVDHPADVPRRCQRVRNQRHQLPFDGCAGAALRLRHRARDARHRRAGQARRDPRIPAGGPTGVHRGSRRRAQAPQAQGEGGPQARLDVGQPGPAHRPDHRAAAPAQAAGPPGRDGPSRPDHPGRSARRPAAAGRRRPGHPARPSSTTPIRPRPRCAASTTMPPPGSRRRPSNWHAHESAVTALTRAGRGRAADLVPAVRAGRTSERDGAHRHRARPAPRRSSRRRPPGPTPMRWTPRPKRSRPRERQLLDELAESPHTVWRRPRRTRRARRRRRRGRTRAHGRCPRRSRPPGGSGEAGRPGRHHAHPRRVDRRGASRG